MLVLTSEEVGRIETEFFKKTGRSSYSIMDSVALAMLPHLIAMIKNSDIKSVLFFCGRGKNGGDGMLLAHHLKKEGVVDEISLFLTHHPRSFVGSVANCYETVNSCGLEGVVLAPEQLPPIGPQTLVVDSLLGIGVNRPLDGIFKALVLHILDSGAPVFAVDNPTGFNPDSGRVETLSIRATKTASIGAIKIGQVLTDEDKLGEIIPIPVEIPFENYLSTLPLARYLTDVDVARAVPPRKKFGSKFDHGVVVSLSGSRGMTGAATLAAKSAMRSGCGLVKSFAPYSSRGVMGVKLTEEIVIDAPETVAGSYAASVESAFAIAVDRADAVLIGPGLSREPETMALVGSVLSYIKSPLLLDGDGLFACVGNLHLLKDVDNLLITPHRGEWNRLFGPLEGSPEKRVTRLRMTAVSHGITIVYKGMPTIIASPDGEVWISLYGTTGLATAGSGDVLSGVAVSFIAQGASLPEAARAAVAIHGRAGELASDDLTDYCVTASDIISYLPKSFKSLLG